MSALTRTLAGLALAAALLGAAGEALAAAHGSYAMTVYGEPPKYPPGFQHFDYVNPDAPKGGSLSRASMEIGQFNYITPYADQGIAVTQVNDWVYSPLAFRSLDEPYTVYGLVAERMERDPDGLWVRFYLDPRARFADGTPITAQDVRYTFDLLLSKGSLSYRQQYGDVRDVVIEGPGQVRFDFKNNLNRTLALDLATLRVLPEHWWKSRDFANGGGFEPPLGSGPYKVGKVDAGRSISFERDPNWWAKDLPVSRGMYNFDSLTVNFYGDTDVARQLLQAGAFDYNREFSSSGYVVGYDSPALRDGRLQQAILAPDKPTAAQGFVFNLQRPVFHDRRVRQALTLLWDFEWTNKQMMRGFYVRQQSYWPKSEMAASALPDAREREILDPLRGQIPDEVFSQVYRAPQTDGSGRIRDKQLQALRLLAEAGWTPRNNRLVNAAGEPLEFTFLDGQGGFDRMLLPYKRTLAQIGITLNLRRIDSAQYINLLNARDYDMIVTSFPRSGDPIVSPGRELYSLYGSQSATQVGSSNSMVLANPAVDRLIDGLVQANSRDEMVHYARALDRVLQWGQYMIPNYYSKGTPTVFQNRFGRPAIAPIYDEGLNTWWEVSPKALTASQMSALHGTVGAH
ncbi:ABC transporter, periplasmic substrate-binding protein yejA [Pseudomonas chlororaphis subsp. aureofaciens]|uniref:extracellular solute-binding protein n=1 Tax=Pseudomonas chlororaphis TaxID=587753 RepID=UPI000F7114B6|nr:extracellular solute-binding protein [Pseudomonas chlororaphis]AZE16613.1 ABC transporter, periplasmic substrate-binding protein yejA [Pseudomonas chlororaphis subsp. aureofaciens]QHC88909.1 ABC transporter substrate-binding protein [Pseudomonas chlororaphis]